jgi:hypothetical protein
MSQKLGRNPCANLPEIAAFISYSDNWLLGPLLLSVGPLCIYIKIKQNTNDFSN